MKKIYFLSIILTLNFYYSSAQLKGKIIDATTTKPLIGVNVMIKGKQVGTLSDRYGHFNLQNSLSFPLTLTFTSVGYKSQELLVFNSNQPISIVLKESNVLVDEVVVSSSRFEESSLSAPATIETLNSKTIRESTSLSFYDEIRNLKGIDFTTNSVFFSSVNIRGANNTGNVRVAQIIDGMDNQAPGLNFAIGNLVGLSELDLNKVELISGASSALYGSAAMNGAILMNSKNPFEYQGLSASLKTGIMNASNRTNKDGTALNSTPYNDFSLRFAKSYKDKIAFKVNLSYQKASDWQANDSTDVGYRNGFTYENGTRVNNAGYNGVNIYGDEVNTNLSNLRPTFNQLLSLPNQSLPASIIPLISGMKQVSQLTKIPLSTLVNEFIPSVTVGRTGYKELDLADYQSYNLKLNGAIHYRINEKTELILAGNYGSGTTVYTASDRYFIKNFNMGQYKLELRGNDFFIRAYTTQERSGDTYAIGIQSALLNEAWKPSLDSKNLETTANSWFPQYGLNYAGGALQVFTNEYKTALLSGQTAENAYLTAINAKNAASNSLHFNARKFADTGRPIYGTEKFDELANKIAGIPIPNGGKFLDKSNLYHVEFAYNFSKLKFANILIGGSYRTYDLNSEGTLFSKNPETGEEYSIHEFGAYIQGFKAVFHKKLRITTGLRYDKNISLMGQFTPRIALVYSPQKEQNIRVSYQTGFRLPTSQDQYIDLSVPGQHNLGGVRSVIDKYDLNGKAITEISYNKPNPVTYTYGNFEPEQVRTFEFGYKTIFKNWLLFDAVYYHSTYTNKLSSVNVVKVKEDKSTEVFNIVESFPDNTFQQGFAFSVDFALPAKFSLGINYSKDVSNNSLFSQDNFSIVSSNGNVLADIPPRNRWNFSVSNKNILKTGINFKVSFRHQAAATNYTSIVPRAAKATANQLFIDELNIFDTQISKKILSLKSILKIGGTNLGGNIYRTTIGNPYIGSTFYVSILFDELLN